MSRYVRALGEATDHDAGSLPRLTDGSVASLNALTEREHGQECEGGAIVSRLAPTDRPSDTEATEPAASLFARSVSASGEPQPDPATGGPSSSNPLRAAGLRHEHGPHLTGCGSPDAHQQLVIGEAA